MSFRFFILFYFSFGFYSVFRIIKQDALLFIRFHYYKDIVDDAFHPNRLFFFLFYRANNAVISVLCSFDDFACLHCPDFYLNCFPWAISETPTSNQITDFICISLKTHFPIAFFFCIFIIIWHFPHWSLKEKLFQQHCRTKYVRDALVYFPFLSKVNAIYS